MQNSVDFLSIFPITTWSIDYVYLANNVEILLHDHFSGCIETANPLGLISIPRGFAPWDEISPSGLAISMHPSKWSCNNIFHEKLVTRAIIIIIALEGDNSLSKIIIFLSWKTFEMTLEKQSISHDFMEKKKYSSKWNTYFHNRISFYWPKLTL